MSLFRADVIITHQLYFAIVILIIIYNNLISLYYFRLKKRIYPVYRLHPQKAVALAEAP